MRDVIKAVESLRDRDHQLSQMGGEGFPGDVAR